MTTTELIKRCAEGDREAMDSLYRTFSPRMLRLIRRYVPDRAAAEDILHDGFIIAFTRISDVRDYDRFEFWIGTIMKNLSMKYLGSLKAAVPIGEDTEIIDSSTTDDSMSWEDLSILIERLPDGYKTVFRLAVLEGLSHKEIADILGIAPHSSSSQLARAKAMLRKLVTERRSLMAVVLIVAAVAGFLIRRMSLDNSSEVSESAPVADVPELMEDSVGDEPESESLQRKPVRNPAARNCDDMSLPYNCGDDRDSMVFEPQFAPVTVENPAEVQPVDSVVEPARGAVRTDDSSGNSAPVARRPRVRRPWNVGVMIGVNSKNTSHSPADDGVQADPVPPGAEPDGEHPTPEPEMSVTHQRPIAFGVSVSRRLSDRISLESGLTYTLLRSSLSCDWGNRQAASTMRIHYVGVPLKVSSDLYRRGDLRVYVSGGLTLNFPVHTSLTATSAETTAPSVPKPGLQLEVDGGFGLSLRLWRNMSLYTEPSVVWYPRSSSGTPTLWRDRPVTFTLPVGIRFEW